MKQTKSPDLGKSIPLARLSATIDANTLDKAHVIAQMSGYRFSFSRYLNDLMDRDIQAKAQLLNAHP